MFYDKLKRYFLRICIFIILIPCTNIGSTSVITMHSSSRHTLSHQYRPTSETPFKMAFRWWADSNPLLYAYLAVMLSHQCNVMLLFIHYLLFLPLHCVWLFYVRFLLCSVVLGGISSLTIFCSGKERASCFT